MLVDLNLQDRPILILGEGRELETRTRQFLDAGAKVIVAGRRFSEHLKRLTKSKPLELVPPVPPNSWRKIAEKYNPYAVIIATTNRQWALRIAERIHDDRKTLVYAVDLPELNDFNMPAVARLGDIRVAVSTGGRSPAMARLLRKRIERVITTEDIKQVQLHALMRDKIRSRITSSQLRKACVYKIIKNERIKEALYANRLEEAKRLASKQIELIARKERN